MKNIFRKDIALRLALYSLSGLVITAGYTNCQKVSVYELQEASLARINAGASMFINNDAPFTNSKDVMLSLFNNSAAEMYVTNDPTCQGGGEWETYAESKAWVLSQENGGAKVYSKFRESKDSVVESSCYSDDIVHDAIPPVLMVTEKAPKFTNQASTSIRFTASDSLSGIEGVECKDSSGKAVPDCQENLSVANSTEGPGSVTLRARDKAGNVSIPVTESWIYDKTPPTVALNSTPSSITNVSRSPFTFSGSDNFSSNLSYECKVDAGAFASCSSPFEVSLGEGNHTFMVQAKDEAGNVSAPASYSWKIDQSAPTVILTSTPPAFSNSTSNNFAFEGVGKPIVRFECQMDSAAYASCTSPKAYTLTEGSHTFRVRGYDAAGNVSSPALYSWVVDTTRPSVVITSTPPSVTKDSAANFTFTAADTGSGVDYTECSLNNSAFTRCTGNFNTTIAVEGTNKFIVRAVDRAGNTSNPAQYQWLVDRTAPMIEILSGPDSLTKEPSATFVMRVSDNSGIKPSIECRIDGAAYAPCTETQMFPSITEGPHTFQARAVDSAGNMSAVVSHRWTADLRGPAITFTKIPLPKIGLYDKADIAYTVTDDYSGIAAVSCGMGTPSAGCPDTKSESISGLAPGTYSYVVRARDSLGNVSTNSVTFTVENNTRDAMDSVTVNTNNKVDVLIVIDNSGSMAPEQKNMAERFSTFFDKLAGLDWQLSIVTTDVSSNAPKKDGRFLEFSGMPGTFILKSSMDLTAAKTAFSATIQRPANEGSGNEQGIAASYRSVQRSQETTKAESAANVAFFRPSSALAILVVTDANETNPAGTQVQNVPSNLVNLVRTTFPGKPFSFHSIVVKSSDATCLGQSGNEGYGTSYEALSNLTGGIIGSVCEPNYSEQLGRMGEATIDLVKSVTLSCLPLDTTGDGKPDIRVTLSTGGTPPAFEVDGLKVTFATGLPKGTHQINFTCLK